MYQETDDSHAELRSMKPNEFMVEGYKPTKRKYLHYLHNEGDVVPIHGLGGCVLFVEARLHRLGLNFPPFLVDHHVETEGFAKALIRFGVKPVGLPFVNVLHDLRNMHPIDNVKHKDLDAM